MKIDPWLRKFFCFGLIGCGAMTVMSAVVGTISAWKLIEPSDADSVGITRSDFVVPYVVMLFFGGAMIYLGLRWRK